MGMKILAWILYAVLSMFCCYMIYGVIQKAKAREEFPPPERVEIPPQLDKETDRGKSGSEEMIRLDLKHGEALYRRKH